MRSNAQTVTVPQVVCHPSSTFLLTWFGKGLHSDSMSLSQSRASFGLYLTPPSCGTASMKSSDAHGSLMTPPVRHYLDRKGSSLHWRLHALLVGSTAMLANLETPSLLTGCWTHFVVTRDSGGLCLRGKYYLSLKSEGLFNYLGESNTRGRCEYNILSSFCMYTLFGVCKQIGWVLCLL